jgi:hypothetical protein
MLSNRFKKLVDKFGWKISPVLCKINGKVSRRPDILAVENHGKWEMTIPSKIYGWPNQSHRDLLNLQHPDYFELEAKLYQRKYGK